MCSHRVCWGLCESFLWSFTECDRVLWDITAHSEVSVSGRFFITVVAYYIGIGSVCGVGDLRRLRNDLPISWVVVAVI